MPKEYYPEETARYDLRAEEAGSKAKVLDCVAKAAYDNNRAYERALTSYKNLVKA